MLCTYLANDLVILQHAPGDVDAVVIPVGSRHVLVYIGVDTCHGDCRQLPSLPTTERDTAGSRGEMPSDRQREGRVGMM